MQCKDIPTAPILRLMASETDHWWYWMAGGDWSIQRAMPEGLPPKLVRAKMAQLIHKDLVDGCPCGCRGDYELTDKGREYLKQQEETVQTKEQIQHRLNELNDRREQHGTMTGDTTEREYEDLCDEIDLLEQELNQ